MARFLICALLSFLLAQPAFASSNIIYYISSVAWLTTHKYPGVQMINLLGYHSPGDQGGGILVPGTPGTCSSPNNGIVFEDSGGNCWQRLISGNAVNARWFGAYGDTRLAGGDNTCSMSSGSATLTCNGAAFTSADIGKTAYVAGAGAAGATLQTSIQSVTNATTAVTNDAASTTVASVTGILGHDDTAAIQAAFNAATALNGGSLYIPGGTYLHHGLNFTASFSSIRGDSSKPTLWALACTDPGSVNPGFTTTGVDVSEETQNTIDNVFFQSGYSGMEDIAPTVGVLAMRGSNSAFPYFAIQHNWRNDSLIAWGSAYNAYFYGYEQTDFYSVFFSQSSNVAAVHANIVLSAANTANVISPWISQATAPTSDTTYDFNGFSSIDGYGTMLLLDEGSTLGVYQISITNTYFNWDDPSFPMIADTTGATGGIRFVNMNNVYVESGACTTCVYVKMNGYAAQWNVSGFQIATSGSATVAPFSFSSLTNSYWSSDIHGAANAEVPIVDSPICSNSVINTGEQNTAGRGVLSTCNDFALALSGGPTGGGLYYTGGAKMSLANAATQPLLLDVAIGSSAILTVALNTATPQICRYALNGALHTVTEIWTVGSGTCGTTNGSDIVDAFWDSGTGDYEIKQSSGGTAIATVRIDMNN